jgi:hypothetical protein
VPYRRGERSAVAVALEIERRAVKGGARQIDVSLVARDRFGTVFPAVHHSLQAPAGLAERTLTPASLRFWIEIELPAGQYQLRAAVADADRTGALSTDVDVPDYRARGPAASGLVITSVEAEDVPSVTLSGADTTQWPGALNTDRTFKRGETIGVSADVYESRGAVRPVVQLRGRDRRVIVESVPVAATTGNPTRLPIDRYLKLDVAPGDYIVHFEVSASSRSIVRDVPITIVE